jgi:hypothetical protein
MAFEQVAKHQLTEIYYREERQEMLLSLCFKFSGGQMSPKASFYSRQPTLSAVLPQEVTAIAFKSKAGQLGWMCLHFDRHEELEIGKKIAEKSQIVKLKANERIISASVASNNDQLVSVTFMIIDFDNYEKLNLRQS